MASRAARGLVGGIALLLAAPAGALAADTYVDNTRPDNTGDCLTPATACKTIAGPVAAVSKTGPGDTIFVVDPAVPTTYPQSITLTGGRSLISLSPDPGEVIIDNGTGGGTTAAITVDSFFAPLTIEGFTVRSDYQAIDAGGLVTIRGNVFDEPGPLTGPLKTHVRVDDPTAGDAVVSGNEFSDPAPVPAEDQGGLNVQATMGTPEVSGNSFADLTASIESSGDTRIARNTITGTRQGASSASGIRVVGGTPAIVANLISGAHFDGPGDLPLGIFLLPFGGEPFSPSLRRNRVLGHSVGVWITAGTTAVSLESDLIADSTSDGLSNSGAEVTARNVSVVGSAVNDIVLLNGATLALDSSIVGASGINAAAGATCTITFSRGPTTSGTPCQSFQTSADPLFADAPGGDYRLQPASPLIDAGNPAKPPAGALDLGGVARALAGTGSCLGPARRDVGAYEFECSPPNTKITKRPKRKSRDRTPKFKFRSSGSADEFLCRLDSKPYKPCTSPRKYRRQPLGRHKFRVKAVDPGTGLADPSPAVKRFRIVG